jgi:hypothetical protein
MDLGPTPATCDFPLLRRQFLAAAEWLEDSVARSVGCGASLPTVTTVTPPRKQLCSVAPTSFTDNYMRRSEDKDKKSARSPEERPNHNANLKPISLNLANINRDDVAPSELQLRREKFAYFEKRCSPVYSDTSPVDPHTSTHRIA